MQCGPYTCNKSETCHAWFVVLIRNKFTEEREIQYNLSILIHPWATIIITIFNQFWGVLEDRSCSVCIFQMNRV